MTHTYSLRAAYIAALFIAVAMLLPAFASAAPAEKVGGFLCTVNLHGDGLLNAADHRSETAAEHVGIGTPAGDDVNGDYVEYVTVAPHGAGDIEVSANATNTGTPGDGFSTPGDPTYTAIWESQ